jgi:hypothetical protein
MRVALAPLAFVESVNCMLAYDVCRLRLYEVQPKRTFMPHAKTPCKTAGSSK